MSNKHIYIASCSPSGGILHYTEENGALTLMDFTPMDRPMYMAVSQRKMHIILCEAFENGDSGVITYEIDERGKLINPSPILSTQGKVACHISVHNEKVYCANYISGSVMMLPDKLVQHTGCGPHTIRQDKAHAHFIGPTPDGKFICAVDLGTDSIYIYNTDLTLHNTVSVPAGQGARHLAFSADGQYAFVANELGSTVAAFFYCNGNFTMLDICSCLPADFAGTSTASAIRVEDGFIYVSNRGHDSIAKLSFDGQKLQVVQWIPCCGQTPRDIIFIGDYLFSANQNGHSVTVFHAKEDYRLVTKLEIDSPLCIISI